MTMIQSCLPPVLALVALSFLTGLLVLVTRLADLVRGRRPLAFYEDFEAAGQPAWIVRPTRQLANQFEYPVLFYTLIALAIGLGLEDAWLPGLAWGYVGLRWAHAASHLWFNRLYVRTPVFIAGNLVLLAMWAHFATAVL